MFIEIYMVQAYQFTIGNSWIRKFERFFFMHDYLYSDNLPPDSSAVMIG